MTKLSKARSELSPFVDAFITDTFDRKRAHRAPPANSRLAREQALGGTCRSTHYSRWWTNASECQASDSGSTAGVDSHTGVEDSSGRKSRGKVQKFLSEAYETFEVVKQSSEHQQLSVSRAVRVASSTSIVAMHRSRVNVATVAINGCVTKIIEEPNRLRARRYPAIALTRRIVRHYHRGLLPLRTR
jgi:hypothetical protein